MFLSCLSIPLASINFSTEWNLHPWQFRAIPTELQEDLALNGVIHPPLVIADSEKTFAIVSGTRRIEFIRKFIGPSQVDCMVIDKDAPHNFILNLILADQSCASELSLAEKAQFVAIAARLLKLEDIVATFQGKLQLKNGRSTIPNLLKILQQDVKIIREIHAGNLQDRMVSEILALPEESDRLALVQLFKYLGMGDGKQKRFFNLIRDIAFREGSSVSLYLQKKEITEILDHKEMNIPQKIHHLGNLLQNEITPTSSLAESAFAKQVKSLHLPASHSISHSPSFEKDEVTLSITFKNFADCERYLCQQQERIHIKRYR
jgi:hypothetical protein